MKKLKKLLLPATVALLASAAAYAGHSCHTMESCVQGTCIETSVCIYIPEPVFNLPD